MATTARSVITQALIANGAYSNGEDIQDADAQVSLTVLINQLDAWAADSLTLFALNRILFTVPSGTQTVTIGTGGTIDTVRPIYVNGINYFNPGSSPAVEVPMGRMDDDSFMNQTIKGLSSNLPTQWYYQTTFPLGTLWFWPVEAQNIQIAIYCNQPSFAVTTLDSTLQGPPGYMEGFIYQLALRLCLPFARQPQPLLAELASQAFARLKRPNLQPGLLGVDAALVPAGGGYGYNILSDGYGAPGGGGRS